MVVGVVILVVIGVPLLMSALVLWFGRDSHDS